MLLFPGFQKTNDMKLNENIWLIAFIIWGLPLTYYRSKFRKIVYRTKDWKINIKPLFVKEIKGLFGNIYPNNFKYLRIRNFYRIYLTIYLVLFTFYFASGNIKTNSNKETMEIKIGSTIPDIILKDQNGETYDLKTKTAGKNVVLYFYPKDDTPGCTAQACSFRDQYEDFIDANAIVVGISGQSVDSHKKFAETHNLPFTLLSDEGNKIRKLFGVPTSFLGLLPGRVTYIINKEHKVVYTFNSQTKIQDHIENSLKALQNSE